MRATQRTLTTLALFLLCLATAAAAARPFPETVYDSSARRSIFIFSDQLSSSLSEGEARFAAAHYVGCQKMTRAGIDRIRQYNENFIHMHYKLAVTVDSMPEYWMVINGQWVYKNYEEGTNWYTVRQHADWPLKNAQGQMTVHGSPYRRVVMDLTNSEFRDWWVSSCIEEMTAAGADGVFADTYTVPAIWGRTNYPELFGNDNVTANQNTWIPKLNDYGAYVYSRLDSAGFHFYPNIDNLQTTWADKNTHYWTGENIHAAMLESWGNWSNSTDAQSAMQQVAKIQLNGKFLHGESYFGGRGPNPDLNDAQARMWLAGTYLLCNQGRMFLSMYGPDEKGLGMSGRALWFPEYEIDLGPFNNTWNSLIQLLWNGVFRRDYEKGFVVVNPSADARNVDLGGSFWLAGDPGGTQEYWADENGNENVSLAYRQVSSLAMPAFSAAILLNAEPACTLEPAGDLDGDGELGIADVIALLRTLTGGGEDPCLDYNGDGRSNIMDALALLVKITRN